MAYRATRTVTPSQRAAAMRAAAAAIAGVVYGAEPAADMIAHATDQAVGSFLLACSMAWGQEIKQREAA